MTMQRHTVTNHFAVKNVEGGEKSRSAVTFIVMREGAASAGLHRQSWLSSIECLDLTLFVDAQHQSLFRRIHIEADDVLQFFDELRVPAKLERFGQMRLQVVLLPNASHRSLTDPLSFSHGSRTPVSCIARLGVQRSFNNGSHFLRRNTRQSSRPRSILLQPE